MTRVARASRPACGRCLGPTALAALVVLASLVAASTAGAQGRRPGLQGRYASRHVTLPRNVSATIAGPWSNGMLGIRRNVAGEPRGLRVAVDGGFEVVVPGGSRVPDGTGSLDTALALNAGVAFGLTDEIEGGALFASFDFTPDFAYRSPFFVTWARTFGNVDVGARVVGQIAVGSPSIVDSALVVLGRFGTSRVDTALMVPVVFGGDAPATVGVKVPVRYALNPIPELVLGLESGVVEPSFTRAGDTTIPLGGYVGTSWLVRAVVLDVGVSFQWDDFLRPRPPEGVDRVDVGFWRASFGLTVRQRVL